MKNSLVAASCIVSGKVENSILFRGVTVGAGAEVRNCVIMQNCVIGPGAVVENIICDKSVTIGEGVRLSGSPQSPFVVGKEETL